MHAYQIALSSGNYKNPPKMEEMFPLPYDEIEFTSGTEWITDFYNNANK